MKTWKELHQKQVKEIGALVDEALKKGGTVRGSARLLGVPASTFERWLKGHGVIHVCSCGIKYTRETWEKLPLKGIQEDLELRNCPCGSTRAVEVK